MIVAMTCANLSWAQYYSPDVEIDGIYYAIEEYNDYSVYYDYEYYVKYEGGFAVVTPPAEGHYQGTLTIPSSIIYKGRLFPVAEIAEGAFSGSEKLSLVSLSKSIVVIGTAAFMDCTGLSEISIPESVMGISASSFANCVGLREMRIPASVLEIGDNSFSGCTAIEKVYFEDNDEAIYVGSNFGNPSDKSRNVTRSDDDERGLFNDCPLTEVHFGRDMSHSGDCAPFQNITTLKTVTFGPKVTKIRRHAFEGCSSLRSVSLPDGLSLINKWAFKGSGLQSVTLPSTVREIWDEAFADCLSLTTVTSFINIPFNLDESVFQLTGNYSPDLMYQVITLRVPQGRKVLYANTEGWKKFVNIEEFDAADVNDIQVGVPAESVRYSLSGHRQQGGKGLHIVRRQDGSTLKVIAK